MKSSYFFSIIGAMVMAFLLLSPSAWAVNSINATFEDTVSYTHYVPPEFVPGQVVPTGDNKSDRPMEIGGDEEGFLIENLNTMTGVALHTGNFLRIVDVDDYFAHGAAFDFYDHSYDSGCIYVSWDALFETNDYYIFYYRNGHGDDPVHPNKSSIANIYTSGNYLYFKTEKGVVFSTPYETGVPIHFDTYLDLDNHRWAVVMNGQVLFNDKEIMEAPFGRFILGYGHDSNYVGAMQVDNIVMMPMETCSWPEYTEECEEEVPTPELTFIGTEDYSTDAGNFTRYKLSVSNWADIPASLFRDAPDLPPCGINTNSSRTWVDIYDGDGNRLYGFCALGTPQTLTKLWFARPKGEMPPSKVKIVFNDRLCDREYESNYVEITGSAQSCEELPTPTVDFSGTEGYSTPSGNFTRYFLTVINWEQFPEDLFAPSPNLSPCGNNTSASRTWVEIYDDEDNYIYGFCALDSPQELADGLWFSKKSDEAPPTAVKVVLKDRLCNLQVVSPPITIPTETLYNLKIEIVGSGRVVSTDGSFLCDSGNITMNSVCTFNVSSGDNITFKAIPISGSDYTASFVEWGGACSGSGNCTVTITGDTNIKAQFAAVGTPVMLQLDPPTGTNVFTYLPVVEPVLDSNASMCKPFAIGDLATGNLSLKVGLPPFSGQVDVYLGLQALAVSPFEVFLFKHVPPFGYTIVPYSTSGLVAWATSQVNPIYQSFFGDIPLSALPKGLYHLYTLVTPKGTLSSYYLWITSFEIK